MINLIQKELVIMKKNLKVHELTQNVLDDLEKNNFSPYTIKYYKICYDDLQQFMQKEGVRYYSIDIGLMYIQYKFGISIEGFYGKHSRKVGATTKTT